MAKALIFSDLHLHAHKDRVDRLQDCIKVLEWVFETAAKEKCEYIFFLGDLFHERAKIDVLNYLRTFEVFMKHMIDDARGCDMYLLVGNHDMYHKERWDINSIKPLSAIPGIHIVQSPVSINCGGRRIDWLPHTENPIKEIAALKQSGNGAGDILFAHLAVNGALTNTFYGVRSDVIVEYDNEMMVVNPDLFDDWKMTMLGHYHGAQKLSATVEYVGSPLQLSYGEAFQKKHIVLLDLDTMEKTYIENTFSPKHLIVSPQDIDNEAYNLDGQFVRIAVQNMGEAGLIDLQRKVARESKPLTVDVKVVDRKTDEEDSIVIEEAKAILLDTKQMLQQYIKDKGVPDGLDAARLLATGEECLPDRVLKESNAA